ncbi:MULTISPECIES: serine hydrolase [unclassified Microbacterium]|uniref:serine hydrolase n=1 Tax=unclassified Microbacterium TaxID=2609290 RepID=UPI00300FFA22
MGIGLRRHPLGTQVPALHRRDHASRRPRRILGPALVLVALTSGITACTAPVAGPAVATGDSPAQDAVSLGAPLEERIADAVRALPQLARDGLDRTGVPGMSIAVVHGDRLLFSGGYGLIEKGGDQPVTADTVFQIASISKPLSATAVAAVGREIGVDWSTPISSVLPDFELSDPVVSERATIGDAFSHRMGLATGSGDDLEDIGYDRDTILSRLRLLPLAPFRSSYHYSNFGLTVGAEAVSEAAGEPWEDLIDRAVFEPLAMTSSSARHEDYLAHPDRARLHALVDGSFEPLYDRDPDPQSPAGGVSSTANDMSAWMRLLLAGGSFGTRTVADPDLLREAMTPQIVNSPSGSTDQRPGHYGFGFNASPLVSGRMAVSHSGAFSLGAATAFQVVPDLDLGIVVLTNGAPVGLPEAVAAAFLDLVQFGEVTRDWVADAEAAFAPYTAPDGDLVGVPRPADPAPAAPDSALVGRYLNPYFGEATVRRTDDGLVASIGPDGRARLLLEDWDGSVFAYSPSAENAPAGSRASAEFVLDGGTARTLRLSSFDTQGFGTWTRAG